MTVDFGAAKTFLSVHRGERVVLLPHPDADGLCGAAILRRTMLPEAEVVCPPKGVSIHDAAFGETLRALAPQALVVVDQGSRAGALLPGVPTLTIDHHVPSGIPEGVYLTSFPNKPTENASVLCYRLVKQHDGLEWLAAVGAIGDYGSKAPFPEVHAAVEQYGATDLQDVVALVNAARRSAEFAWSVALAVLLAADKPRQIADGELPEVAQLRAFREEVQREAQKARRHRPYFADPWAVIPFGSPCLVHGLVAQSWARRLHQHYVVAANFGYRPGYVHFAVRTALPVDLIAELRALVPEGMPGEWAHGHAQATGGSLPHREFTTLLNRMGFPPKEIMRIEHPVLGPRG